MTPVTNDISRRRNIKKTFSQRMKTLRRELKTFSRRILSAYSSILPAFGVLGKKNFFTVKVNTNP